jgi:hypothetical protein
MIRVDAVAQTWPLLASLLVGLGLVVTYHLVRWRDWPRIRLLPLNVSLLLVILAGNLVNGFGMPADAQVPSGALMLYVAPYLLLVGVVAGITFTFTIHPTLRPSRIVRYHYQLFLHLQDWALLAALITMLIGVGVTHLRLSTDYRIAYPLWFGYLLGGIILWFIIVRLRVGGLRRYLARHPPSEESLVLSSGELPRLPPLNVDSPVDMRLPALPPLDRREAS